MKKGIIISGFGGQGIMLAGTLLCHAGMLEGKYVTFFPSYGAEMRGGTANCQVCLADEQVGSPVIYNPDILLCLNKPSFVKFSPRVTESGLIIANSSLFQPDRSLRTDIISINATEAAEKCGTALAANMVMLGALAGLTGICGIDSLKNSLGEVLASKKNLISLNAAALEEGKQLADSSA